jgi:hypothetical protein
MQGSLHSPSEVRPLHAADNSVSACFIFFSIAIFASTLAIFASAFSRISSQVDEEFFLS